jgi:peroxiredoxin
VVVKKMDKIKVGDDGKGFSLKDQDGNEISLSQFSGKRVLLSFHPLAWTGVCTKQMQSLEENKETFDSLNTVALGISVDSVPCKKAWAENIDVKETRILSDFWPHGGVAKEYGLFLEDRGISCRANVIIDENQKVVFVKEYDIPQLPDINEILEFIKNM